MRILMILYNLRGKGTYWRALYLARGLAKQGHQVTVLCSPLERQWRFEGRTDSQPGVTVVTSPNVLGGLFTSGWDPFTALGRIVWSFGKDFDLIHGFESRPTVILPALYWQRVRRRKMVLDWCDWFGKGGSVEERPSWFVRMILRPFETFFEERFRVFADGITEFGSLLRQKALDLGVPPERIVHISNGSSVDELYPLPQVEAREALNIPQDVPIVGYIGAIFRRDARLMAEAFEEIRAANSSARLLLIGYFNEPIEAWLSDPSAVQRTGRIPYVQINQYLAACDVCWLPLRDSGANRGRIQLKLNDYMAVGKPVVATDVGDGAEWIRRGAFGLLVPDDPHLLAQQVLTLLADPELCAEMGRKGRATAETEYRWDDSALKLEAFYDRVLAEDWE